MRSLFNSPAAARPAAPQDSAGAASPQQPQPRSTVGTSSRLGWLCCLPIRNRNAPALPQPQDTLGSLHADLLHEVVARTADAGDPRAAARQLAVLRPVSKAFRNAADRVQQEKPAVQRAAAKKRLADAIGEATREYDELATRTGFTPAEKKRFSAESKKIMARLAAVVHSLDLVVVDLDLLDKTAASAKVAQTFRNALFEHQGAPPLEIATSNNARLDLMTQLLDARPQWLRSLAIGMIEAPQAELSKVLAKQTNLAALALTGKGHLLDLDSAGLGPAIASLPGLKSLTLSRYFIEQGEHYESLDGTALAKVLGKLPGLEDLDLHKNTWTPAAFAQVAPSLANLSGLLNLDLSNSYLGHKSDEENGARVAHLAPVLPALAKLQTLNLANTGLGSADFTDVNHLADGLASLKQLQTLNLARNPLGPEGASHLAPVWPGLAELRTLNLASTGLDPAGINHLADGLAGLKQLQTLNLRGNPLGPEGFSRLVRLLPALANLRTLDLGSTNLGPADIDHLASGLAGMKQLQTLDLDNNLLGPEDCSRLTASLAGAPALQHLHLTVPQRQPHAPTEWKPVDDVDTLANVLRPLARRQGLHIHLHGLDKVALPRLQSALPALRIHDS
jgi:Leucine-rich repeat (LRR) protein